ncbi:MAG: peroxide stress protein YaaA [Pseudomonadales bacterium]|nr:peroxide stress protein YaaA [Pseudomonadales bacterium]MCP5183130.1 peroxide stress protein YaaA [Pseudomonadales bacterium]
MLALLSPAKTLDYSTPLPTRRFTEPRFVAASSELIERLRAYATPDLASLMNISDKLAEENRRRYAQWSPSFTPETARQAIYAFKGDVYLGLEAARFSTRDLTYAQKHLRILSGLHGLLRPLDLIQPYRLEMGTALDTPTGRGLYGYWRETVTDALNADLAASGKPLLLNLASNEYFDVVDRSRLQADVITVKFLELKNGSYKFLSFYGKKARGLMAAWFVTRRATTRAALQRFDWHGYRYSAEASAADEWTFLRDVPSEHRD